jgi:hypothetical protein
MLPVAGLIPHMTVTPVGKFWTVNSWVPEGATLAVAGLTLGVGSCKVTNALATFVGSATLVATTVIICSMLIAAGALKVPFRIVPTFGTSDQVTAVFVVPVKVAPNCADWPPVSETEGGDTAMATTGMRLIVALAFMVGSAALEAVRVTVCGVLSEAGATYNPLTTVPTGGTSDHVAVVLVVPVNAALNCWLCDANKWAVAGISETATTGLTETMVLAELLGSATLVAVTAIVCGAVNEKGAAYSPVAETLPTAGLIDQTTDKSVAPVNVVVNCSVCEVKMATGPGLTESVTVGRRVIAILPDWVGSEMPTAVTSTVCTEVMDGGAVNTPPEETVPTCGLNDHVTDRFPGTSSVDISCRFSEALKTGVTNTIGEVADNKLGSLTSVTASKMTIDMSRRFTLVPLQTPSMKLSARFKLAKCSRLTHRTTAEKSEKI